MRYKAFGNTGVQVSELAFGTWGISGLGWDDHSEEERSDAILAAVEQGVTLFDTAPAYNDCVAERLLGKIFAENHLRDKVLIATKCGNEYIGGKYVRDGRSEMIFRECEKSLKNLRTDYIDFYLVHWPDPNVPLQETFSALAELKRQGKVRFVGVSNFTPEQIAEASKACPVDVLQLQYSMVNRDFEARLKAARAQGMATMTYGSVGGGILTGRYRTLQPFDPADNRSRFYPYFKEPLFSHCMELLSVLDEVAAAHEGASPSQVALNWSTQKDFVDTAIVGAQKRSRVTQNTDAFRWQLSADELRVLDAAVERYTQAAKNG